MKKLLVLFLLLPFILSNCGDHDKCKNTDCGRYGNCNPDNGNCECPEGVTKIDGKCDIEDRQKFIKTFNTTCTFCDGSFPQGTALSFSSTGDNNDVLISFGGSVLVFTLTGNVIGSNISIASQPFNGDEYSGNGNLSASGNLLLLTITRKRSGAADCVFNISGT